MGRPWFWGSNSKLYHPEEMVRSEKLLDAPVPVRRIIISLFSRLLALGPFLFAPFLPSPSKFARGIVAVSAMWLGSPREYELLNLDKGSRLGRDVLGACTRPAIRRPNAAEYPCNQVQSRRLLIYTSGLVKAAQRGTTMRPVCKNHKHRVRSCS